MSRRARDTGSIYQSGGRWRATVHDASGRRRYLSAASKKQVTAKLREAERAVEKTGVVQSEKLTLGAFLNEWLAAVKSSLRPTTFASYSDNLRLHVRPTLGRVGLTRLAPTDVQRLINTQIEAGRSARSIKYANGILRNALTKAEKWGYVSRNVARLVEVPRVTRTEIHPLTPGQTSALLSSVAGTQDEAVYLAAVGLGLRKGELLGLRWEDVDLDAASVTVHHTLQRLGGVATLAEPKTAKSRRTVSAPAPVIAVLRDHRKRQLSERIAAGPVWQDLGFVFASPIGTPLDASAVTHRFHRQLAAAGLPRQRFHDLRHACASYLLAANVPMKVVQEILGHSQLSTTADIYSHVAPELQREAADRLGALLDRTAAS